MPAPETPAAPAATVNEPAAPPAANLPIDTLASPDTGDTPDFMSAIDKAFEAAERGEDPNAPDPEKVVEPPAKKEAPAEKVVSPKAADFAKVKADRDQVKSELEKTQLALKELQDKLALAESSTSELPTLKEKLAEYEKEISGVRVEASPEYAKVVGEPANRIRSEADRLATKYKIDRNKVIDAFAETDPSAQGDMASDLASSMNQRDQFQFYQLIDDFNAVMAKKAELQAKSQDVWQEIQQTRDKQTTLEKENAKKTWKAAEEEVWSAIEKRVPNAATIPNIQTLRNQVAARHITELSTKEQAYSSMAGLLLPHIVKQASAFEAKVKELETSLAKFKQATPGAGGGAPSDSPAASDASMGGFLDSIERRIAGGH